MKAEIRPIGFVLKSILKNVASTKENTATDVEIDGKSVNIGLNTYIKC